jgi:MerR family redox-sensitive transcriptional activator SoxR
MARLSISEVAKEVGLRPSAIRYYEEIGILEPAARVAGQRRYDKSVLYRLTLIQRAQRAGFSLTEIQELFSGFGKNVPASARWLSLSQRKVSELDEKIKQLQFMQQLLQDMIQNCACDTLDACGKGLFLQIGGTNSVGVSNCCSPEDQIMVDARRKKTKSS